MSLKPSGEIKKGPFGHDVIVFYPSPFLLPFLTTLFLSLSLSSWLQHTRNPLLLHTLFLLGPSALLFLIPPPLPHNQQTNATNATTPTTTKPAITAALERPSLSLSHTHTPAFCIPHPTLAFH
ncbi:hypothetical protein K457DRAFT_695320 [Linnemannia elongata AG-77]|uniref:Uncharacterized protein n=1 Tax=Linnemannia elongata AG-77 TaxID=1314771 RepID=A0A197JNF5_9FUNG|nr:hypothetical protein K457DRAFT_695320 [Linnemannia elongata AG-77]